MLLLFLRKASMKLSALPMPYLLFWRHGTARHVHSSTGHFPLGKLVEQPSPAPRLTCRINVTIIYHLLTYVLLPSQSTSYPFPFSTRSRHPVTTRHEISRDHISTLPSLPVSNIVDNNNNPIV
jgi:hypothetical protein